MNESRSIPTATSFRELAVDTLDAKRKALNAVLKERGMKVSFTHLIAWAIVKAAQEWPVMGRALRGARRQAHRDRAGRRQPRHRRRRRAQGPALADGPLHQGRRPPRLRGLPLLLRGADHQDAGEQPHRRRLPGHQHQPDQPRRARHGRLGAAPADGPGHDRRLRLARLSGRVEARAAGEDQGARGLEGHDDDLDLRPPRHPGRRVRLVPAPDRGAAAGRGRLLRVGRHATSGIDPSTVTAAHAASASAPPLAAPRRTAAAPRVAAKPGHRAAPGGAGRDLAAQGLPDPRPPGRAARSARLRAEGRPGDPAREPRT